MTNKLTKLMEEQARQRFAFKSGTETHVRLQNIFFDGAGHASGDGDIVDKLTQNKELVEYMGPLSRAEVPIAGYIDGKFKSLRIDRLYINKKTKQIVVLDYKTDINKDKFYQDYVKQLTEYHRLLVDAYPGFTVRAKILWTNDFTLENVI